MYVRSSDPSVLEFSLSLYRHPSICILFHSRFTSYNKHRTIIIVPLTLFPLFPVIASTSGCLHWEFVCLLFLQTHWETDRFLTASGVQLSSTNFHFHRVSFSSHLKSKVGNILVKVSGLRIVFSIDGTPITSRSHSHPSHIRNSRLFTSSLSLGGPVPRETQWMWDA